MRFVTVLAASVLPGLAWVWFFYRQDRYDKEPPARIAITFVAGMAAVVPAALIQLPFREWLLEPSGLVARFLAAFLVVGLGEEAMKLLSVYLAAYRHEAFDEPLDGIIYAVTASLGFAALENLFYAWNFGIEVAPVRAVVTTLAHASFGGVAGFYLGIAPRGTPEGVGLILRGLFIAALLHGVYDFLILSRLLHPVFGLLIVYLTYRFVAGKIRRLRRRRVR